MVQPASGRTGFQINSSIPFQDILYAPSMQIITRNQLFINMQHLPILIMRSGLQPEKPYIMIIYVLTPHPSAVYKEGYYESNKTREQQAE
jgi:hypothetical protein